MAGRLAGKTCIITGSGGAIGRASALTFAREGARVVGCGVRGEPAQETVDLVRAQGGEMVSFHPGCDLSDPTKAQGLIDFALENYGQIDVLFNNAGNSRFGWMETFTYEDWQACMRTELDVVFNTTKAAWPALTKSRGTIVNTASVNGWMAYEVLGAVAHTAAKGAVLAMTKQLAMEGRHHGIRANTLSPGLVETPITTQLLQKPEWSGPMLKKIFRGSPAKPSEIAAVALFLASDESSFVNGADILVDGGTTAW